MNKIKISACFCDIPLKKLIQLVRMRFVEGIQTEELMKQMKSGKDRDYVATISLLDVREEDVLKIVELEYPSIAEHLLSCRSRAIEILEREKVRSHEKDD